MLVAVFKAVNQELLVLASQHAHRVPVAVAVARQLRREILLDVLHIVIGQNVAKSLRLFLSVLKLLTIVLPTNLNKVAVFYGRRLKTPIDNWRKDLEATKQSSLSGVIFKSTTKLRLKIVIEARANVSGKNIQS